MVTRKIIKPTSKAKEIDAALTSITGKSREETIRGYGCTTCDVKFATENDLLDNLGDNLSIKEYNIAGMCRQCQDSVFGGGDE